MFELFVLDLLDAEDRREQKLREEKRRLARRLKMRREICRRFRKIQEAEKKSNAEAGATENTSSRTDYGPMIHIKIEPGDNSSEGEMESTSMKIEDTDESNDYIQQSADDNHSKRDAHGIGPTKVRPTRRDKESRRIRPSRQQRQPQINKSKLIKLVQEMIELQKKKLAAQNSITESLVSLTHSVQRIAQALHSRFAPSRTN